MNNGTEKGTREGVTVSLKNPFTAAPVETDPAGRYEAVSYTHLRAHET